MLRTAVAALASLLVIAPAAAAADELLVANHAGAGSRLVDLNDNVVGFPPTDVRFASWSPDGNRLIANVGGKLTVMDLDGTSRRVVGDAYFGPVFSPDGKHWAAWRVAAGALELAKGSTIGAGSPTPIPPPAGTAYYFRNSGSQVEWSSRDEIAFAYHPSPNTSEEKAIGVMKSDGSNFRKVLDLPVPPKPLADDSTYDDPLDLAFTPDGKTLAVGRYRSLGRTGGSGDSPFIYDFRITTVAVQPGGLNSDHSVGSAVSPTGSLNVTGVYPVGLSYAPDGQRLAVVGSPDGDITRMEIYRPDLDTHQGIAARTSLRAEWRPSPTDTDGDRLPDAWETSGADFDNDGNVDLDLPAMGADPQHVDLFIELDYMSPHRIQQQAVDLVVQAFADAPVANPDNTTGIALHVDNGPGSVMDPGTGATWGSDSEQSSVAHVDVLGTGGVANYDWSAFDAIKSSSFPSERAPVFHYGVSAHGFDPAEPYTGMSRGIPGSDFMLTLGESCERSSGSDCTGSIEAQAADLMHEFGHNLGLEHGGNDSVNGKPSYLSVMNYAFSLTGLRRLGQPNLMDFSRFDLLPVNENALDESKGFGVPAGNPVASFWTIGSCPDGTTVGWTLHTAVDFDCDGALTPGAIGADLNGDGARTMLPSFNDWKNLQFDGGAIGAPNVALPAVTSLAEPTYDEQLAAAAVAGPEPDPGAPGLPGPGDPGGPGPGAGGGPGPGGSAGTVRLELLSLAVRPRVVRPARRGGPLGSRRGTTVSYGLNVAGRVRFRVERRIRKRFRRVAGQFEHSGLAGSNSVVFTGRVRGRPLRAGTYRLVATPLEPDGQAGASRRAPFSVRR